MGKRRGGDEMRDYHVTEIKGKLIKDQQKGMKKLSLNHETLTVCKIIF
jgi:hypothetical protein